MYGPNRFEQIAYVKRVLKEDGLFFFIEKMKNDDRNLYLMMEEIKDKQFKARYFEIRDIVKKQSSILTQMEKGQVTLKEFYKALRKHFKYSYIIWNSTNFYHIVASNDIESISKYISLLPIPYVPQNFIYKYPILRPLSEG